MNEPKACRQEHLARNEVGYIQRCVDCGCVSIHIGPMTIRLDDRGLEALWAIVGEASAKVHRQHARCQTHLQA